MLALAISVGLSSIAIGSILSTALLIGPAATSLRLTTSLRGAFIVAGALGVGATWLGVLLAYDSYYWFPSSQGLPGQFLHRGPDRSSPTSLSGLHPCVRRRTSGSDGRRADARVGKATLMFSGFMVNAWVIGTIVAIVAGVVGFFVVLRGAAFPAHAIPNGAFAGAAGANLLGVNPLLGLGVFSLAAALGIGHSRAADAPTP